jgi:hypothetical protein
MSELKEATHVAVKPTTTIGIIVIATGRYIEFIPKLFHQIKKFLFLGCKKIIYLFTDNEKIEIDEHWNVLITRIERQGYPKDTLYRYNYILKAKEHIMANTQYLLYIDADMDIVKPVYFEEFMPPPKSTSQLVAVFHPGYYDTANERPMPGTPETRVISLAYIMPSFNTQYVCGGVQGGRTENYIDAITILDEHIRIDEENGIVAIWHDESHWNWYCCEHRNNITFRTPKYCWSEHIENSKYLEKASIFALKKSKEFHCNSEYKQRPIFIL